MPLLRAVLRVGCGCTVACSVLVCLPVCGHGRGNGAPCAGRAICASLRPLDIYIYVFGSQSCTTRHPLLRSAPLRLGTRASPSAIPSLRSALTSFGGYPTVTARGTLGSWANGACVRLSLRGKARLLPCAVSTVRSAILRRRDTAFSSRLRPLAHPTNCRRAVPLRLLLTHAPLARPSAMARFVSQPLRSPPFRWLA